MINERKNKSEAASESVSYTVKVLAVRPIKDRKGCYRFNANVNGVTIYGMQYVSFQNKTGEQKEFISFPSYKGSDGKFYNVCYFKIEDGSDLFKEFEKQIEEVLNSGE